MEYDKHIELGFVRYISKEGGLVCYIRWEQIVQVTLIEKDYNFTDRGGTAHFHELIRIHYLFTGAEEKVLACETITPIELIIEQMYDCKHASEQLRSVMVGHPSDADCGV